MRAVERRTVFVDDIVVELRAHPILLLCHEVRNKVVHRWHVKVRAHEIEPATRGVGKEVVVHLRAVKDVEDKRIGFGALTNEEDALVPVRQIFVNGSLQH